jgi:predicted transcriptional regulator
MRKKKKDYILNLVSRRKIYHFILKHPGTYLREISRELKIPISTIDYHLHYLMKEEVINTRSQGRFIRYYIKEELGRKQKEALSALRDKTALHIALILSLYHVQTRKQFSKELEKSQSTVTYHLKNLIKADVVEKFHKDNLVKYKLKNEKETDKLLIQYKEGLLDEIVVLFYDYYNAWNTVKWVKLVVKFLENNHEETLEFLYYMFPHPYWG